MSPHYRVKWRIRSPDQSCIFPQEKSMALPTTGYYTALQLKFQTNIASYGNQLDLGE